MLTSLLSKTAMPRVGYAMVAILAIVGCDNALPAADRAELQNIAPWHEVPKSTPNQLIRSFDRFCVRAPTGREAREALLRSADYVPARAAPENAPQVYLVDDRRPAITENGGMCIASARARTGQAERFRTYLASAFPDAQPIEAASLDRSLEQAWRSNTSDQVIIATRRSTDLQNRAIFDLIYFNQTMTSKN